MANNVEAGKAARGILNLGTGVVEELGAEAINPGLIGGTIGGFAKGAVDLLTIHGSQSLHDFGNTLDAIPNAIAGGPGGILGGIAVGAIVIDGIRRTVNGGADIKEGFGR